MLSLYIFFVIITFRVEAIYLDSEAPQTILVNNMELPAVRTNRSQKDAHFIAEYQYADGDVVNVICINFLNESLLTMEYEMAGVISDKSTMNDLSSSKMIGFETKLHSGHNNSYMICTRAEADGYTKVMLKFVMQSHCNNIVFIKINGIPIRPYLDNPINNLYRIDYKYENVSNQLTNVTCEVERTDVKLLLTIHGGLYKVGSFMKTETNKKDGAMFHLSRAEANEELNFECAVNYLNGTRAETVDTYFTAGIFPTEQYPLHMELPSDGRVMELYNDYHRSVIFYEYKDGETLQLTCGQLLLASPGPDLYLGLDYWKQYNTMYERQAMSASDTCNRNGCSIHKTLSITRKNKNTPISCYLKEKRPPYYYYGPDDAKSKDLRREIRVIFRERVLTTTTTTTSTTSTTTTIPTTNNTAANPASKILTEDNESANQNTDGKSTLLVLGSSIGAVIFLLVVIVAAFCFIRNRKTKHIETPYGDLFKKSDFSTSQHTKENENQYELCHYRDHLSNRDTTYNTPEGEENIDPKDDQYTEIDYLSCKPKTCETQIRISRVYDEPYVHFTMTNKM